MGMARPLPTSPFLYLSFSLLLLESGVNKFDLRLFLRLLTGVDSDVIWFALLSLLSNKVGILKCDEGPSELLLPLPVTLTDSLLLGVKKLFFFSCLTKVDAAGTSELTEVNLGFTGKAGFVEGGDDSWTFEWFCWLRRVLITDKADCLPPTIVTGAVVVLSAALVKQLDWLLLLFAADVTLG